MGETTTGGHPLNYPSESAVNWTSTFVLFAQAVSDYLDTINITEINTIDDSNDNEVMTFAQVASAVNYLELVNAATGNGPTLTAKGDDTNVDLNLVPKGSGQIVIDGVKWPASDGTNGQTLQTDGSGNLSFVTAGGLSDLVDDTTPQLGGQLDVNGQAIGDGTRELLTFTEDASAVNHINIENEASGSGPTLSAVGDDTNVDLNINPKGSGTIELGKTNAASLTLTTDLAGTEIDINGTGALGATADGGDYLLVHDTSAAVNKKVLISNLPGGGSGIYSEDATSTPSGAASVELTLSTKSHYIIRFRDLDPTTDPVTFLMTVSDDAGSTYKNSLYKYATSDNSSGATTLVGAGSDSASSIQIASAVGTSAANAAFHGEIHIFNPSGTTAPFMCSWNATHEDTSGYVHRTSGSGHWDGTAAINKVKFAFSAGNISGKFSLEARDF